MKLTGMSIPNFLTVLRISLIPIFIIIFYSPLTWRYPLAAGIYALAALTDWLDGYLARKLNQTSPLGEFLDPVADKLIVAVALVLLVEVYATPWLAIPAAIIICREIAISALREWMAELGKRARVAVSFLGKFKTSIQMIAIILLLSQNPKVPSSVTQLGYILLYLAVWLTLLSMLRYLRVAWAEIQLDLLDRSQ